jgi:hypothetical protein
MSNPSPTHQHTLNFRQMHAARGSVVQGYIAANSRPWTSWLKSPPWGGALVLSWGGDEE